MLRVILSTERQIGVESYRTEYKTMDITNNEVEVLRKGLGDE